MRGAADRTDQPPHRRECRVSGKEAAMMDPQFTVFAIFLGLALIWSAVWIWVLRSARHPEPYSEVAPKTAVLRRRALYILLPIFVLIFGISMWWLPYPQVRASTIGPPQVVVNVTGQQWYWTLSRSEIPKGVPVEFVVTAKDVNHGFALYSPEGVLLTQVQAMPGHPNHLIYAFDKEGTYTIRCLEYCGLGHHGMAARLTVS
ncbi:cytochrome c oxidase subunit II [Nitrolancea hollandica]|nr:cytochrome c oxidase subunit II [Nitrolancea hollandica]